MVNMYIWGGAHLHVLIDFFIPELWFNIHSPVLFFKIVVVCILVTHYIYHFKLQADIGIDGVISPPANRNQNKLPLYEHSVLEPSELLFFILNTGVLQELFVVYFKAIFPIFYLIISQVSQ